MFDELREIDTASIEELVRIKKDQEVLEERLARMEGERENVSEVVFERVLEDYAARGRALDDEACPLKEQARGEYRKLQDLYDRLSKDLEVARLDKEELEFRHQLGEFEQDVFQERLDACGERLEELQGEQREVEELKQQFIAAFRSQEELEAPREDLEEEPSAAEEGEPETSPVETAAVELDDVPGEPTEDVSLDESDETALVDTASPPPPAPDILPGDSEATIMIKGPRLVIHRGESLEELRLELDPVTIGRALDNSVRFMSTSVSRYHARVAMTAAGYTVNDLGSGNGTLVNSEPLTGQRQLRNGDMIQVGSEVIVFHDR